MRAEQATLPVDFETTGLSIVEPLEVMCVILPQKLAPV